MFYRFIEDLASYGEGIIAMLALALTLWQFCVQRRHNRVSVKPHLVQSTDRNWHDGEASFQVSITNNGLGPAFIKQFKVFYRSQETEPEEAIAKALGDLRHNCSFSTLGATAALSSNEERVLLRVKFKTETPDQMDIVRDKIDLLDVRVEYESAYGEKQELDSRQDS